jgi:hypothetical protein
VGNEQWARIVKLCMHPLRRGTWHRVVDAFSEDTVTLEVGGQPFVVDRDCVVISDERPVKWSVVKEDDTAPYFGGLYGVCPECSERMGLKGGETEVECPACRNTFAVDWVGAA